MYGPRSRILDDTTTDSIFQVCPGAGVFEPHFSNFWLPPGSKESIDDPYGRDAHGVGHYTALDINLTHP